MGEHTPPRENILLRDDGHVFSQRMQQQFACIRAGYFVEENRIAFFPKYWPPRPEPVWVSYTFAYGTDPASLTDGSYVTAPLSITEWRQGMSTTTETGNALKEEAVQGIIPLDEEALSIFETDTQVSEYCLSLTGMPDITAPETKEMLAYYSIWFRYNGAFLDLIYENHSEFINWIRENALP